MGTSIAKVIVFTFAVWHVPLSHAQVGGFNINEGLNGSWYNPNTSGQGILIEVNEKRNVIFVAWFTFDPQQTEFSQHQWFTASGDYSGDQAQLVLYQSTGGVFDLPTQVETVPVGTLDFQFDSCIQSTMTYTFEDSLTKSIALKRLTPDILCQQFQAKTVIVKKQQQMPIDPINIGISGAWYEPDTTGQGLLIDVIAETNQFFAGWFTYSTNLNQGNRWLTLQGTFSDSHANLVINETTGGIFNQPVVVNTQKVGDATIDFVNCQQAILNYTFIDGVAGSIDLQQLLHSDLCEILQTKTVETPDELGKSTPVAFYDVSLLPMTDEIILPHQTVIVRDGIITDVAHYSQLLIPDDVVILDGSGKYLGPGLSEMHMHLGLYGGQTFAQDSGLMFIANGVTTVLNMGDNFSMDVPLLGQKFTSTEIIGPTLYSGNTAYGPPEDGSIRTIISTADATTYANLLKNSGYQFIKEYWFLTTDVLDQFQIESERLNLPIIGHLPRTRTMQESLQKDQRMIAHIQEPYVTYFNGVKNPNLLQPAAQIIADSGAYLTLTLAVFESYIRIYGGNIEQFNELRNRPGNQYMPASVKQEWTNFYNDPINQGSGQQAGGLDSLYEFFKQMTREFHQANIPLLIGTDAPGFPGVMPGFGTHVEMKLLSDVGLSNYEVYKAASKNAGDFIAETLKPEVNFGTIEEGSFADLILLNENPLTSLEHLKEPSVVMSHGYMWSREFLQNKLDVLEQKQIQNKAMNLIRNNENQGVETWLCLLHLKELNDNNQR